MAEADGPFVLGEEPRDHEVVVVGGRGVDLLQEAPVPREVLGGSESFFLFQRGVSSRCRIEKKEEKEREHKPEGTRGCK